MLCQEIILAIHIDRKWLQPFKSNFLLKAPIFSTEYMMILMLWLHRVHSKLLSGMLLLKASKSCPKKIFWSWCCQTASLWRKGEERLATFFGCLFFSPSVTLEMGFWYAQNCCTECNIVLYKLSLFYGDDRKSQNILSHEDGKCLMIIYKIQYLLKYVFS